MTSYSTITITLKDIKLGFSRSMHQYKPCQPFSKVCPFYLRDLLLGPQELRLVAVWSTLVLVLLDEFCLFCSKALLMRKITTLLSIQYSYVRITRANRRRGKERSEMTKSKINSVNCEQVWIFSFHMGWFRRRNLEVSSYTIDYGTGTVNRNLYLKNITKGALHSKRSMDNGSIRICIYIQDSIFCIYCLSRSQISITLQILLDI